MILVFNHKLTINMIGQLKSKIHPVFKEESPVVVNVVIMFVVGILVVVCCVQ